MNHHYEDAEIERLKQMVFIPLQVMIEKDKITILHVVEALGGGVYSYFTDLSQVMGKDSRINVVIAYSNRRDEIDPDKVSYDFHPNVKLILLDLEKEISPIADLKGIRQIKQIIRQVDPDIIHLHSSKAGILGKIAVYTSGFKRPSYYTPHGYAFLRQDISKTKRLLFKIIEQVFTRFSSTITIACGDTEWEVAKSIKSNAKLIRNGADPSQIPFLKKHDATPSLTLGTLGRISFPKNPKRFNGLANKLPDHDFLWIGSGELKNELTSANISVTGWFLKKSEAVPYLKQLDVYLQTSLWEGLPIAVIEAMAMGLPVIATNIIGNKDLVKHNETGFLVNTDEDFLRCVRLLEDPELRTAMGKAGRERVEKHFDCTKNFRSLVDLYLSDLSNSSQRTN